MQVRNEWPLCALSIAHALTHVDEVVVIDSGSDLVTRQGLTALCQKFDGRLRWFESDVAVFDQEAAAYAAAQVVARDDHDWIYHIDADEFILVPEGRTLLDILESTGSDVVEYDVQNWVSTRDFDLYQPESYRSLTTRSLPTRSLPVSAEDLDELRQGGLNYFDIPFLSKVIMRWGAARIVTAGGHVAREVDIEKVRRTDLFQVAHLPLLSRTRLAERVAVGRPYVGTGTRTSWQSQLVAEYDARGDLELFWRRHTVGPTDGPECATVQDERLTAALEPFIELVRLDVGSITPQPSSFPFSAAVFASRYLLDREVQATTQKQRVERQLASLDATVRQLRAQREALVASRTWKLLLRVQQAGAILRRGR